MKKWLLVLALILCFSTATPAVAAAEAGDIDGGDILPPQHSVD